MKYLHLLVAGLFALFAYWQLNDPDWPMWVLMYGSVAAIGLWSFISYPPGYLVYLILGVAVIWMLTLVGGMLDWIGDGMPSIAGQMQAETPHIELTREFFGLLIATVVLTVYARRAGSPFKGLRSSER